MDKLIIGESDGSAYWLPDNYKEFCVEASSGIPADFGLLSSEEIENIQTGVYDKLKHLAKIGGGIPEKSAVRNVYIHFMTNELNKRK